jgi:hypothetical protein
MSRGALGKEGDGFGYQAKFVYNRSSLRSTGRIWPMFRLTLRKLKSSSSVKLLEATSELERFQRFFDPASICGLEVTHLDAVLRHLILHGGRN